ncbi:hypothetical protein M0R45_019086 [Rubus argutus]|uniref:Uncharacterized protein n=1 Tax=Rubus argutus TaxID=59490 RepID=A0AAW1X6S1_RUBAR
MHVLPDFHGNRSPIADPKAKRIICGITLETSEKQLALQSSIHPSKDPRVEKYHDATTFFMSFMSCSYLISGLWLKPCPALRQIGGSRMVMLSRSFGQVVLPNTSTVVYFEIFHCTFLFIISFRQIDSAFD